MVYIIRADFTGDQLNPAIKHSQTLKKMGFMSCKKLTSSGIIRILEWSGANLTSLDLSYLDVTFSKPLPFTLIHLGKCISVKVLKEEVIRWVFEPRDPALILCDLFLKEQVLQSHIRNC